MFKFILILGLTIAVAYSDPCTSSSTSVSSTCTLTPASTVDSTETANIETDAANYSKCSGKCTFPSDFAATTCSDTLATFVSCVTACYNDTTFSSNLYKTFVSCMSGSFISISLAILLAIFALLF